MAKSRYLSADRNHTKLEDLPNVGPAIAKDLRRIGVLEPESLVGRDPFAMYDELCRVTGQRHDPCLLGHVHCCRALHGRCAGQALVEVHGGTKARNGGTKRSEPVMLPDAAIPYGVFRDDPCSAKVG